jgi:L-2,4-diaminobutyric acid acetyltransferase
MWRLAKGSRTLDVNSPYAYLLACRHFRDTTVVAAEGNEVVGFVVAYRPPTSPEAVFVWQIAVGGDQQGNGLGGRLLDELIARQACRDVTFLEATVTPSNVASKRLFYGFARRHGAEVVETRCFPAEAFPAAHEEEILLRIGGFHASGRGDGEQQMVSTRS